MHRWGPVHVGWEGDAKVGAGTHGKRAACMGGGWHAWEEGGMHGRRVACMGGGRHAWEGSAHGRRAAHMGGGRRALEGGVHGRAACMGGAEIWRSTDVPMGLASGICMCLMRKSMHECFSGGAPEVSGAAVDGLEWMAGGM